jgi:hypothetical protein
MRESIDCACDWTRIPRSSIPKPSYITDWAVSKKCVIILLRILVMRQVINGFFGLMNRFIGQSPVGSTNTYNTSKGYWNNNKMSSSLPPLGAPCTNSVSRFVPSLFSWRHVSTSRYVAVDLHVNTFNNDTCLGSILIQTMKSPSLYLLWRLRYQRLDVHVDDNGTGDSDSGCANPVLVPQFILHVCSVC